MFPYHHSAFVNEVTGAVKMRMLQLYSLDVSNLQLPEWTVSPDVLEYHLPSENLLECCDVSESKNIGLEHGENIMHMLILPKPDSFETEKI